MAKYAADTGVPVERSKVEIEKILMRYGATSFVYGWESNRAVVGFEVNARRYRISMLLPRQDDSAFAFTETGRRRTSRESIAGAWEQAVRQKWRALALYIKAVLEAAESGIISIEEALQPFTVLPNGRTVGEWLSPQIENLYLTGRMPPMLPGISSYGEGEIVDG